MAFIRGIFLILKPLSAPFIFRPNDLSIQSKRANSDSLAVVGYVGLLEQIKDVISLPSDSMDLDVFLQRASSLSEKELECLRLLLQGKTAKNG